MAPNLFRVIVPVNDIDAAARFYSGVFGDPGLRVSPGRHYFRCGATILACFDPRADGDPDDAVPRSEHLYFSTGDLEGILQKIVPSGGRLSPGEVHGGPAGEIVRRPWGERSFYAHDPFGNALCFVDETTLYRGGGKPS